MGFEDGHEEDEQYLVECMPPWLYGIDKKPPPPDNYHLIERPLQVVAFGGEGKVVVENHNLRISFRYSAVNSETIPESILLWLREELDSYKHAYDMSMRPVSFTITEDDFRKLDELVIEDTSSGTIINLVEHLPENSVVLFNPIDIMKKRQGQYNSRVDNCTNHNVFLFFGMDFTIPEATIALLHEAGHAMEVVDENMPDEKTTVGYTAVVKRWAKIVRHEEEANLFMYRILGPIIRFGNIVFSQDNIDYSAQRGLDSYLRAARNALFRARTP